MAPARLSAHILSNLSQVARSTRELLEFAVHFEECDSSGLALLTEAVETTTTSDWSMFFAVKTALDPRPRTP